MTFSVNTNEGALKALQNLNKTNMKLQTVQTQINTGLKVASTKDNAATWAIAQILRADVSGLNAARGSIDRALSTLDVAVSAGEAVSDLLIEMKEKAVAAKDPGIDSASRTALNNDFVQLRDQIQAIVRTAEFNGINAVGGPSPAAITAITDSTGSSANQITVAAQDMSLGGTIVTVASDATMTSAAEASSTLNLIEASLDNVNAALSRLGAGAKRLELQKAFTAKLSDALEVGIGNLVDADMAKASATLQAVQVKQQLGLQALSIANQAPGSIISLFQG